MKVNPSRLNSRILFPTTFFIMAIFISVFITTTSLSLVSAAGPDLEKLEKDLEASLQKIMEKNILKYGNRCSVIDETKRTEYSKKFLNLTNHMNPYEFETTKNAEKVLIELKNNADQLLRGLNGSFCNSYVHLQCNSSGLCSCGSGESLGFKNLKLIRVGDACKVPKGSICTPLPNNIVIAKNSSSTTIHMFETKLPSLSCGETGSSCVIKGKKEGCTNKHLEVELVKLLNNGKHPAAHGAGHEYNLTLSYLMKKIEEGICVCSGGIGSNNILSNYHVSFVLVSISMLMIGLLK